MEDERTPQRKRRTFEHVLEVRWPSTGGHRRLIIGTPPNLIGVSNACFIRVMRSREEVDCEAAAKLIGNGWCLWLLRIVFDKKKEGETLAKLA